MKKLFALSASVVALGFMVAPHSADALFLGDLAKKAEKVASRISRRATNLVKKGRHYARELARKARSHARKYVHQARSWAKNQANRLRAIGNQARSWFNQQVARAKEMGTKGKAWLNDQVSRARNLSAKARRWAREQIRRGKAVIGGHVQNARSWAKGQIDRARAFAHKAKGFVTARASELAKAARKHFDTALKTLEPAKVQAWVNGVISKARKVLTEAELRQLRSAARRVRALLRTSGSRPLSGLIRDKFVALKKAMGQALVTVQ